jgi:hypothetical protein
MAFPLTVLQQDQQDTALPVDMVRQALRRPATATETR